MLYVGVLAAFIISCGIVVYLTPKLLLLSLRKKIIDHIDGRKIHTAAASRLGGFSFFPAIFLSVCLSIGIMCLFDQQICLENITIKFVLGFCSLFILYILGVTDDIVSVRYRKKFVFQIIAALLIVFSGTWIKSLHGFLGIGQLPDLIGIVLTVILLVFIMNSINLIDGIDGLASLLSILALWIYGTLFLSRFAIVDSLLAFAALGALVPFFYFNVFKVSRKNDSKIFMGDAGSLVIGFMLGVMAIELWNMEIPNGNRPYPYILAYTMLFIPCFDAVRVALFRVKDHKSMFLPDNNHIHHNLIGRGFSQRQALLIIVLGEVGCLFLNIFLTGYLNITFIVLIDILFIILFFKVVKYKAPVKK